MPYRLDPQTGSIVHYPDSSDLADVATSGDYNDLNNLPDLSLKADLINGVVPLSQLPDLNTMGSTFYSDSARTLFLVTGDSVEYDDPSRTLTFLD